MRIRLLKAFPCPRCSQIIKSMPFGSLLCVPIKGYQCPLCKQPIKLAEIQDAARKMTSVVQSHIDATESANVHTANLPPETQETVAKLSERHHSLRKSWLLCCVVIAVTLFTLPSMGRSEGRAVFLVPAIVGLWTMVSVWRITPLISQGGRKFVINALALFTVTLPIAVFLSEKIAVQRLREAGIPLGVFGAFPLSGPLKRGA